MRYLWFCLVLLLVTLVGCGSKQNLDQKVDELVQILQKDDYKKMQEIADPVLVKDLPAAKFKVFSAIIQELGEYKERSMTGIQVKAGKGTFGDYKLTFAQGDVPATVIVKNEKLIGFHLKGKAFEKAHKKITFRKYKDFKVFASKWVLPNGKDSPKGAVFGINQAVRLNVSVQGLTAKNGKYYMRVDADLLNAQKKIVLSKAGAINMKVDVDPEQPALLHNHVSFRYSEPGLYNLKLTIFDMYANAEIEYEQSLHIK